jgi:hypothetical protein
MTFSGLAEPSLDPVALSEAGWDRHRPIGCPGLHTLVSTPLRLSSREAAVSGRRAEWR